MIELLKSLVAEWVLRNSRPECNFCGKRSHWSIDCPKGNYPNRRRRRGSGRGVMD